MNLIKINVLLLSEKRIVQRRQPRYVHRRQQGMRRRRCETPRRAAPWKSCGGSPCKFSIYVVVAHSIALREPLLCAGCFAISSQRPTDRSTDRCRLRRPRRRHGVAAAAVPTLSSCVRSWNGAGGGGRATTLAAELHGSAQRTSLWTRRLWGVQKNIGTVHHVWCRVKIIAKAWKHRTPWQRFITIFFFLVWTFFIM